MEWRRHQGGGEVIKDEGDFEETEETSGRSED